MQGGGEKGRKVGSRPLARRKLIHEPESYEPVAIAFAHEMVTESHFPELRHRDIDAGVGGLEFCPGRILKREEAVPAISDAGCYRIGFRGAGEAVELPLFSTG